MARRVLVDTNLLVLLVVGLASEELIARHKRTRVYDTEAFRLLRRELESFTTIVSTPHVLAETSNLTRQCAPPASDQVSKSFARVVGGLIEIHVPAGEAVLRPEFPWMGLTDAALLSLQERGTAILTDDYDVYRMSLTAGFEALNFTHLRGAELT